MKRCDLKVLKNELINKDIYKMILECDTSLITMPGQFVNIKLDGFYLRRPISISDYDDKSFTIIYKVVGEGTKALSQIKEGEVLDTLVALGNGFDITKTSDKPLLVGGGIGVPPLFKLCKELVNKGLKPEVVLGFTQETDVILVKEFEELGVNVHVTTNDGSVGTKGFVTEVMKDLDYNYTYSCGPEPMLKAVYLMSDDGQFSFEARMACGFGACMGCTCETLTGYKRICKDGPIMYKGEIKW